MIRRAKLREELDSGNKGYIYIYIIFSTSVPFRLIILIFRRGKIIRGGIVDQWINMRHVQITWVNPLTPDTISGECKVSNMKRAPVPSVPQEVPFFPALASCFYIPGNW